MDGLTGDGGPRAGVPQGADPSVDWPAALRRTRREAVLGCTVVIGWFVGILLLDDGYGAFRGRTAWFVVGGSLVLVAGVVLATPRARRAQSRNLAVTAALRLHADPGPGVRGRVDVLVRRNQANRWAGWWVFPLLSVLFLAQGHWSRPATAVVGAVLLLVCTSLVGLLLRRTRADVRRWAEDPPGPPRETPPPQPWERWTSGSRLWLSAAVLVVLCLAAGVVVALVQR